jgi:hypothetical protein
MREINFYRFDNGRSPVEDYLDTLSNKQVEKVFFILELIESLGIVPRKFFKKLESTDGIWEARVQLGDNIFRLPGFFDGENLIILTPHKEVLFVVLVLCGDSFQCPLEGYKCLGGNFKILILKHSPDFLFLMAGFQE